MIPESEWKWFGQSGHFICGQWCRFHLCTQIGRFLVSTVGKFVHPMHSGGSELREAEYLAQNPDGEKIGYNRHYETMVFRCGAPCNTETCGCGQPAIIGSEIETAVYNSSGPATRGHMSMCLKIAQRKDNHDARKPSHRTSQRRRNRARARELDPRRDANARPISRGP